MNTILIAMVLSICTSSTAIGQTIGNVAVSGASVCAGSTVSISFSVKNGNGNPRYFKTSTEYTVYLSNAVGNFSSPTELTTFTTSTVPNATNGASAEIQSNISIPSTIAAGTGYKIAVSSSSPNFDGTATGTSNSSTAFTIRALPSVTAGSALQAICKGGTSSALGGSVGGSATGGIWSSDAGGTFTPSATNLNATWTPPSSYSGTATLTLTTTGGTCVATASKTQLVRSLFNAGSINTTGEIVCFGASPTNITSSALASGGDGVITYKWQKNGVDISNSNSATYAPSTVSDIAVTYTRWAKDNSCQTSFVQSAGSWTLASLPQFNPGSINTAGETICYNGDPIFITSATPAKGGNEQIIYEWKANGSPIANSNFESFKPGRLTATTTFTRWARNSRCGSFVQSGGQWTVTVQPEPAQLVVTASTPDACGSRTFTTTNASNNQWYRHDLPIAGATGNSLSVTEDGHYKVRSVTPEGCVATSAAQVVEGINPPVTVSAPNTCGEVTLTATVGSNYQWYRHGLPITGATSITYNATDDGHYYVRMTKPGGSCVVNSRLAIVENVNPKIIISNAALCGAVTLIAPEGSNYEWYRHGVLISGANNRIYTATSNGNYQVRMKLGNNCTKTSAYAIVRGINPEITVQSNNCSSVVLEATEGTQYQWLRHGVEIPNATGKTLLVSQDGNYQVRVKTAGNCESVSGYSVVRFFGCATVSLNPSLAEIKEISTATLLGIKAYPNPSTSQINLMVTSLDEKSAITLNVYDQMGRVVEVRRNLFSGQVVQIGSTYRPGPYFVQMVQGKYRKSLQVIKQ